LPVSPLLLASAGVLSRRVLSALDDEPLHGGQGQRQLEGASISQSIPTGPYSRTIVQTLVHTAQYLSALAYERLVLSEAPAWSRLPAHAVGDVIRRADAAS
jgi:hypothetical protein